MIKAEFVELDRTNQRPRPSTRTVVQFNPETLKVTYASPVADGAVGPGSTRLEMQLWFDVSASPSAAGHEVADVRELTQRLASLIRPRPDSSDQLQPARPLVRFVWGTFQFDGSIDSLEETLEFFSPEGRPLRASLNLSMSSNSIQFQFASTSRARR